MDNLTGRNRDWLAGAILVIAVILTYLPVWHAGYIWDDDMLLTANPCIVGPHGLTEIWTTKAADVCPLVITTFWFEHGLWGLAPLPYHLVTVLFHGGCAVVLWRVLIRLRIPGAWLGAGLWALHPVQVESVAWIAEMKNTESGLFFLLSILFYLRWLEGSAVGSSLARNRHYGFALLFALLAAASKSSTVILPVVLGLLIWYKDGQWRWRRAAPLVPLFFISFIFGVVSLWTQGLNVAAVTDSQGAKSWAEKIAGAGDAIWFYAGKLVWPHPLMTVYPRWPIDAHSFVAFLPALAVILILLLLGWKRDSWARPWFFVFAYFLVALLPVVGLMDNLIFRYGLVFDHFQYLASMGPLALFGTGLTQGANLLALSPWLRSSLAAGLLAILGLSSWERAGVYENSEKLWSDAVAKNPECWIGYNNLGVALLDQGRVDEAMTAFHRSIDIHPNNEDGYLDLANAFLKKKQMDGALSSYRKALEINPQSGRAYGNIGYLLLQKGKVDDALANLKQALVFFPDSALVRNNYAEALCRKGEIDQGIAQYRQVLALTPHNDRALYNLGLISAQKGQLDEAIAEFQQAVQANPTNASAYRSLADALMQKDQLNEALGAWQKVLKIDPGQAGDHFGLGLVYSRMGQAENAISEYRETLKLDPHNADAITNLGNAFMQSGHLDEAAVQYQKALEINPADVGTASNLGVDYYQMGKWDQAIAQFEKVIAMDPNHDLPHYYLGLVLDKKGETAQAIAEYQKALAINPNNPAVRNKLDAAQAQKTPPKKK